MFRLVAFFALVAVATANLEEFEGLGSGLGGRGLVLGLGGRRGLGGGWGIGGLSHTQRLDGWGWSGLNGGRLGGGLGLGGGLIGGRGLGLGGVGIIG